MGLKCIVCQLAATELHHAVAQQELRRHAWSRRRPDAPTFADLRSDPRNMVPLCDAHHDEHHSFQGQLDMNFLPTPVFTFAEELLGRDGAWSYLSRRYTGADHRLDALVAA